MSIRFLCPECQEAVSVSVALAGLHSRCPHCATNIPIPETSSAAATSHGTAHRGLAQEAVSERPGREDSDRSVRKEPDRPIRAERPPPRSGAERGWDLVRYGLAVEAIGAIVALCASVGYAILQCVLFGAATSRGGQGAAMLLAGLGILVGGASLLTVVLAVVGRCLCCTVPAGGSRGLAIGSAVCLGVAVLLGALMVFLFLLGWGNWAGAVLGVGAFLLAGLVCLAAHILYVLFLRGLAAYLGNAPLAIRLVVFLVLSACAPVVLLLLIGLVGLAVRDADSSRAAAVVMLLLFQVTAVGLLGWYANLVGQVRETVAQMRGGRRD